ncbi:hypothetical protein K7432_010088 [Basidiobolus ranarum]|uniref:Uncharacterized protein n=1 Tax=Basidiobolus ranarum TaxID=34480 RepID=A0ABR2WPA1_9FUNG
MGSTRISQAPEGGSFRFSSRLNPPNPPSVPRNGISGISGGNLPMRIPSGFRRKVVNGGESDVRVKSNSLGNSERVLPMTGTPNFKTSGNLDAVHGYRG